MTMRRALAASLLAILSLQLLGGVALAFPEWCDDGSPPPNDFGFRKTGSPSSVSKTDWLRSTDWTFTTTWSPRYAKDGDVHGGVAKGMREAIEHAPPQR